MAARTLALAFLSYDKLQVTVVNEEQTVKKEPLSEKFLSLYMPLVNNSNLQLVIA